MKIIKKTLKYIGFLFGFVFLYLFTAVLISNFSVNKDVKHTSDDETIYLTTNGIHSSVILPKKIISEEVLRGLEISEYHHYCMFGWGNEDFYINTPTWDDFELKYAFNAFFMNTPTAIQLSVYKQPYNDWIPVKCSKEEVEKLNSYILKTFKNNSIGEKQRIPCDSYGSDNFFYKAKGSYTVYRTCNTWLNNGFKQSGLKASAWTIFDFGLLNNYPNNTN